jgi:hypothetical protein
MVEIEDLDPSGTGGLVAKPPIDQTSFETLKPDRWDRIDLCYENQPQQQYRYRLTVVDRPVLPTSKLAHVTAVILVPAGREGEYVFSSQRGLVQLAESANCARVIAVAFGRHHTFQSQTAVQDELTFVVQVVSQQGRFLTPALLKRHLHQLSIPFMALDGIGSRNVLAEGETTMSGRYLIEEVKAGDRTVRRLYFMNNPFVIQSEIAMKEDHTVERSFLAFDYHKHMAAGILALSSTTEEPPAGMVIGLGGGGLVNFLLHVLAKLHLTIVELDPSVVTLAETYFGFAPTDKVSTRIGDGLTAGAKEEGGIGLTLASLDFIAIDVDSKDKSVGMSCPPAAFVEVPYLSTLRGLLRDDGLLVINVSARDPAMFDLVRANIEKVFQSVFISSDDSDDEKQDVNVVIFARASSTELPPAMMRIETMHLRLHTLMESMGDNFGWKETVGELEDCLAGLRISSDLEETETSAKKNNQKKKSGGGGKKKRGKRK